MTVWVSIEYWRCHFVRGPRGRFTVTTSAAVSTCAASAAILSSPGMDACIVLLLKWFIINVSKYLSTSTYSDDCVAHHFAHIFMRCYQHWEVLSPHPLARLHPAHPPRLPAQGAGGGAAGEQQQHRLQGLHSLLCPLPASLLTVLTNIQVSCGKCGNPLGHEFLRDGPGGEGSRFWIFSHSLKFVPNKPAEKWPGL